VDQSTVLIVADEGDFPRSITARWQSERSVPSFTLMSSDLCHDLDSESFDLAIVGGIEERKVPQLLKSLEQSQKTILLVKENSERSPDQAGKSITLHKHEGWLDILVLVASESLRRSEAVARALHLERVNSTLEKQATLGRYILEMRHTLNNALTSVLGNSELMLIEPGSLSAGPRAQVETIRNMALRIHEILQRFSSLEKEFSLVERQAGQETLRRVQAAGIS
jgi:signal transduction histidine kinase